MRKLLGSVLLAAAVVAVYWPTLHNGFVWDDDSFLTANRLIKAPDGLWRFSFTTEPSDYWPVTSTTLWVEWRLWGLHALGYHVTNLVLHLGAALLLWSVLRRLKIPGAYLAALLFAVHPVNVESVAWIAQRKNLVAIWFFLGSILCFLKSDVTLPAPARGGLGRGTWYALSLLSFVLAMLSKGSVAPLPVVLLLVLWWQRRLVRREILRLAPFAVVAIALTLVDIWFQKHGGSVPIRSPGLLARLLGAGAVVWFYLSKALWPAGLSFIYPQWKIDPGHGLWWIPLLAAAAVTLLLERAARPPPDGADRLWCRALLFAWLYFCVMLVPVMGLTDVYFMKFSLVADHYQYLALIGVVSLVAAAWSQWDALGKTAVAAAAVILLGVLTWSQCRQYYDAETLYRSTLATNPNCWLAHYNLGAILSDTGRSDEALAQFEAAASSDPGNAGGQLALANALGAVGRLPEAIDSYRAALGIDPDLYEAHDNLGIALSAAGRLPEAIGQFEDALRLKPDYPGARRNLAVARNNLGDSLLAAGMMDEAGVQFAEALRLNPDSPAAHNGWGTVLAGAGRFGDAITQFQEALRLRPDYPVARQNLQLALQRAGLGK